MTMRDEDISFPPSNEANYNWTLKQMVEGLQENVDKLTGTKEANVIAAHM